MWGPDAGAARAVALQLEAGAVWVNDHAAALHPTLPFGGVKSSGLGRESGGAIGLREFVELRALRTSK